MCFFNRTPHVHIWLLRRNELFMVYNNCPVRARTPFLQQEGDVLFQQDNTGPHMAAAMQRALHGVQ